MIAFALAAMMLFSACGPRSYLDISPHLDSGTGESAQGTLTASNYSELRSAIVLLVEEMREEGTISLINYSGLAEQDVRTACSEVANEEPLGAYGVEYMSYSCVQVLANYEASVSITYSRTAEQFGAIKHISGAREFREEVEAMLEDFGAELVVDTSYYSAESYDPAAIIDEYMRKNPLASVGDPSFEVNMYPASGLHRIVELRLEYPYGATELARRRDEIRAEAESIAAETDRAALGDVETVRALAARLTERSEFLAEREDDLEGEPARDSTFTAYGALAGGAATSKGYALALSALCRAEGMDALIVSGRWNGVSHYWNLVAVDGEYYHVDAALCDHYSDESFLLKTDAELGDALRWNAQALPLTADTPIELTQPSDEPVETE